ncbi:MAG TPA: alcohol dehydrogenase catalytic domain-containing protein [Chloroflexota bacterium]|jgi:threonine dehydrogenase-like Zn-dependent dehydrogenase|nr:alcohol dehydrogenase catalytic domain-containing protein [Chloroflexota bacterium]
MTTATMEALVLTAPGEVTNRRVPAPAAPEGNNVLIRVTRAGICGSELEAVATKSPRRVPPLIMGHEFAGRLEAVGPQAATAGWKVGDRVVPNPLVPCLRCRTCARGLTNACPNRTLLGLHRDGGHAERVVCSARQLRRIPPELGDDQAATAEPLAVAIHAVRLLGQTAALPRAVAVFGTGTIGLMALQAAQLAGATATVVLDVDPARLEVARQLGATVALDPRTPEGSGEGLLRLALDLSDGEGLDGAIDAVGVAQTRTEALRLVRPGGTAVWVGSAQNEVPVAGMDVLLGEKRIQGAYAYTEDDFDTALSQLAAGRIETASWSKVFPLSRGAALFGHLLRHEEPTIKALLDPAA